MKISADTDTKQPIRDAKSYKEAIARATTLQTLLEDEEKRIMEYLHFRRTVQSKHSNNVYAQQQFHAAH